MGSIGGSPHVEGHRLRDILRIGINRGVRACRPRWQEISSRQNALETRCAGSPPFVTFQLTRCRGDYLEP